MSKKKKIDCGGPRARFCRERQFPPKRCVRGTFRTKRISKRKRVLGVFCRVRLNGWKLQSILRLKSHSKCRVCS